MVRPYEGKKKKEEAGKCTEKMFHLGCFNLTQESTHLLLDDITLDILQLIIP